MKRLANTVVLGVCFCSLDFGCGLTIGVLDRFGVARSYQVDVFRGQEGQDYAMRFNGLMVSDVPCGKYSYVLSRSEVRTSFGKISGVALLSEEHQWLTINPDGNVVIGPGGAESFDIGLPKDYRFRGRVRPVPAELPPAFVRVYELYTPRFLEAALQRDGTFSLSNPVFGKVLIVVLQGERVLGSTFLSVSSLRSPTIEITLGQEPTILEVK